jgi:UDP-N-acetylglucosamine:LPS N-acetylglucosamine transferase
MSNGGASELIEQQHLTGVLLAKRIAALLGDTGRLRTMASAARRFAKPNAAAAIVDRALALAAR